MFDEVMNALTQSAEWGRRLLSHEGNKGTNSNAVRREQTITSEGVYVYQLRFSPKQGWTPPMMGGEGDQIVRTLEDVVIALLERHAGSFDSGFFLGIHPALREIYMKKVIELGYVIEDLETPKASMLPNEYQQLALRTENTPSFFRPDRFDGDAKAKARLLHGAIGICTEAGELQDAIKRELFYGKKLDEVNVMEECGDLLWYIAITLDAAGFTMEEAMEKNIAKLRKRYPKKYSHEKALGRDHKAERKVLESE